MAFARSAGRRWNGKNVNFVSILSVARFLYVLLRYIIILITKNRYRQ